MGEMKAGHTPGPWSVSDVFPREVNGADGTGVIVARIPEWGVAADVRDQGPANARLIAAAPDLLESARGIVSGVHSEYRIPADADDDYIHDTIGTALSDAYFSARAAIAKAEGR